LSTEELIRANLSLVRRVAASFGRLGNDPDVRQCGLIGLWRAAEKWDGERDFKAFAKVCIRNAIINHLKQVQRWEPAVDKFDDLGAEDERDLVGAITKTFPSGSKEREILLMLLHNVSKQEIADHYGVSRKTITRIAIEAWEELEARKLK
jgi:RNA polymerase sigma factor (sigma-70 family)